MRKSFYIINTFLIVFLYVSTVYAGQKIDSDPITYWTFKNTIVDIDEALSELELSFKFDTCELKWEKYPHDNELYNGLGPCLYRQFWAYDNQDDDIPSILTKIIGENNQVYQLDIDWKPITITGVFNSYFSEDATGLSSILTIKIVNSPSFSDLIASSLTSLLKDDEPAYKILLSYLIKEIKSLNFDALSLSFIPLKDSKNREGEELAHLKISFMGKGEEIYRLDFKTNFSLGSSEFYLESIEEVQ